MTPAQASRVVVIAALLEAVFVLARAKQGGVSRDVTVKSLWAIGVLTLGLSAMADFVPQIAGPFALLVLVALAARSRGELGQVLGVGPKVPASSSPSPHGAGTATGQESPGMQGAK